MKKKFFLKNIEHNNKQNFINKTKYNYIINVLRYCEGDFLYFFDEFSINFKAQIIKIDKINKQISLKKITFINNKNTKYQNNFSIAVSLLSNNKMTYIIQKLSELGIRELIPLITRYSKVNIVNLNFNEKYLHWNKIVISSIQQSKNENIMMINNIMNLNQLVDYCLLNQLKLIYLNKYAKKNINQIDVKLLNKYVILIGPEGGFSKDEEDLIKKNNTIEYYINVNCLKTDTAAIIASGILINLLNS